MGCKDFFFQIKGICKRETKLKTQDRAKEIYEQEKAWATIPDNLGLVT